MYIKKFNEITKDDVALVGGKGASLGEMTTAGFPVPPGFVITTEALGKIQEEEILKAFDELDAKKVAVRSSGVAEDSSQASWAGQLETYLNVSREDLINKVRECWDSIKSDRALSYASMQNLSKEQLFVAVVVQKMIDAKAAGVMLTVNPVSENRNEVMVESVFGLGEALVQGSITPDNFLVDKETLDIKSKDLQNNQTITDKEIKKLVSLGKNIETHYGKSQDIEWAIDENEKIWILQSRPITTI